MDWPATYIDFRVYSYWPLQGSAVDCWRQFDSCQSKFHCVYGFLCAFFLYALLTSLFTFASQLTALLITFYYCFPTWTIGGKWVCVTMIENFVHSCACSTSEHWICCCVWWHFKFFGFMLGTNWSQELLRYQLYRILGGILCNKHAHTHSLFSLFSLPSLPHSLRSCLSCISLLSIHCCLWYQSICFPLTMEQRGARIHRQRHA